MNDPDSDRRRVAMAALRDCRLSDDGLTLHIQFLDHRSAERFFRCCRETALDYFGYEPPMPVEDEP